VRPKPRRSLVLPRRPRHRADGTAERGVLGVGAARHALRGGGRTRSRVVFVLSFACAAVLIAAPLAFVLSGGPDGGGTPHDPYGVLGGNDQGAATGSRGAAMTTEATRTPPNGDEAAEPAGVGGVAGGAGGSAVVGGSGGGAAQPGGGARSGGGTAAGSKAGGGSGGGSQPSPSPKPSPSPSPSPCPCEDVKKLVCSLPLANDVCAAPGGVLQPAAQHRLVRLLG
jgi:hypothetical protein